MTSNFNWDLFFERIDTFSPDRLEMIGDAVEAAKALDPTKDDLVREFRDHMLSGHYIFASDTYKKL